MEDSKDEKAAKREEKKQQWESFVRKSKTKTKNHTTMVRFYNAINNALILSVILLSGILTCAILLDGVSKTVLAALGASCAVLSATAKFLVADRKRTGHKRFAKLFQTLLIRMLRCDTLSEYNSLWHELQEAIIREPLVLIWHRKSKRVKITYNMAPGLEEALEGKVQQPMNHPPQAVYRPPMNYRPNEFNPHDFHVMSIDNGQSSQQVPYKGDYVAMSGFQENKTRTATNNRSKSSVFSEEKTPLMASSSAKSKKKKKKTDGEKSRQASLASQETLEEIEEEQENEEQQNILTTERKAKQKKGLNNQAKSPMQQDLPPPPPSVGEYDEDEDQELQQVQIGKATPSSSKNFRSTMQSRNDRSIIFDEEEENDLSEDTDDLDENEEVSYPRN